MNAFEFRWALMLLCLLIFVLAFGVLLVAAWRHHRSAGAARDNFHPTLAVEIAWTIVPCVIVVLLVWPSVRIFWAT